MNYKKRIKSLKREIERNKRDYERLAKREESSRKKWTNRYHGFMDAARALSALKSFGTKKHERLKARVSKDWDAESSRLTKERDDLRRLMAEKQSALAVLGSELAKAEEQMTGEADAVDEVVAQVFALNDMVVRASNDRAAYLTKHVFKRLIGEDGRMLSQVSFTSVSGLRRVVAMVNTMTIIQGDMADQAKLKIERFFELFQNHATMDEYTRGLYDLTRQLLVEKTSFRVGPDLYRFLGMDLNSTLFPELAEAQKLLRLSIRSEKTTSYIRLYERKTLSSPWEVVRQS